MESQLPSRPWALITGASSGIGKALAKEFAKDGYDVILIARSEKKLEAYAAELQSQYKGRALALKVDLESSLGPIQLFDEIHSRGIRITALANNAGYATFGEFKDSHLETELAMMQVNMNAVVILTKLFLPDIIVNNGKILITASTASFQPGPYMAVYYATKAFVLSFSEALASELENTKVTVTALCPGPTASGFQDKAAMLASGLVRGKKLPTSDEVAEKGYRAMKHGQRVFIPGFMNWLMAFGPRIFPRNFITKVVKVMSQPKK
jgi:uncharacterized protein